MRNKMNGVVFTLLICLVVLIIGCGKGPAPYTMEAMGNINKAIASTEPPMPTPGMSKQEYVKVHYGWYKEIYNKAGYDLDKTLIQLESDLRKDPNYGPPWVFQTFTFVAISDLLKFRKDKTIDMTKAVPQDVLNAIDSIAAMNLK
ncbi:MAG: hypothetical protein AB2L22_09815 [Syntrophales bacterium]